jgi:ABC-type lipoprotein export system ATPase subunit
VLGILKSLWQEGKTVILITHDEKVATQAARIIRVHDGKIVEDRASRQPQAGHANALVAGL